MDPATFAVLIGVISGIFHLAISVVFIVEIEHLIQLHEASNTYGGLVTITAFQLTFSLIMILMSALMIVGVIKRRARLIVPWVFLTLMGIVGGIVDLIVIAYKLTALEILSRVSYILLPAFIWYPIYRLWKDLRDGDLSLMPSLKVRPQQQQQE